MGLRFSPVPPNRSLRLPLRVRHIARNVLFNWFGTIASMAVGFFLSPFILHRLGNVAYGVWVLAISVVAYLNFLDLGMQNSVLRFVSKGYTKQHCCPANRRGLSCK